VVTIHDLSYLHFPELFRKEDLLQLTNWSKYSILNSAHIIVPSKSTKEDIVKSYKVPASKITITYEGYDKNLFKPQPKSQVEKIKSKYKIKEEYIIFVGTLQPRKNIERLIEAFSTIDWSLVSGNYSLVICGKKGWMYDSILQKSKDLG
ncbi:glycosyltransferase, partial [Staphylococcus aureus]|uniref:glycosyltransferase n=1 Tax=Staphylococcus aureus TaxID=1280 RepID=UPI0039BE30BE